MARINSFAHTAECCGAPVLFIPSRPPRSFRCLGSVFIPFSFSCDPLALRCDLLALRSTRSARPVLYEIRSPCAVIRSLFRCRSGVMRFVRSRLRPTSPGATSSCRYSRRSFPLCIVAVCAWLCFHPALFALSLCVRGFVFILLSLHCREISSNSRGQDFRAALGVRML